MAHWIGATRDYNNLVRQVRACLLNSPRVKRSTTTDRAVTGYVYKDSGGTDRSQSDIGFAIAETGASLGVYRATCLTAGGTASWGAGQSLTVTFSSAGGTIDLDDASSWTAKGFAAGGLIRIEDAVDAANDDQCFRIASITNNAGTNDRITVDASDTLADEAADTVTAYPIGSGAIFKVEWDSTGNGTVDTNVGWLASNVENYLRDYTMHLALNRGNADWVAGDYWEFELEEGPLTRWNDRTVTVENVVISGTNTLTLSAQDQANGVTWAGLGFLDEHRFEIYVSSGTDTGTYRVDAITDSALTVQTIAGGAPGLTNETVTIQVEVKFETNVDFDNADVNFAGNPPTIILNGGGDWPSLGFEAGGHILIEDATDAANEAYWKIDSIDTKIVANDTLILVAGSGIVDRPTDTVTAVLRNGSLHAWTEHRFRLASSGLSPDSTNDAISSSGVANGRLIRPTTDGNYVTEWIGIGPGIDKNNNPQTVYIGMQTQYSLDTHQNVEHRVFDIVSDQSFSNMLTGEPEVVGYTYLTVGTPMDSFFEFDGDHVVGFSDVNSASSSWFYQGYINVRGTSNQLPRPMFLGTNGIETSHNRDTTGTIQTNFFFDPTSLSSGVSFEVDPAECSAWFRWIDGQWFAVFNHQRNNADSGDIALSTDFKICVWPWWDGKYENRSARPDFFGGTNNESFPNVLGRTPTSYDASDRHFVYLPATLYMNNPDENIIGDLKGVYFIPKAGALAALDRQVKGHRVFYVGQNHKDTSNGDFAALELS